jgi:hypothetical protein
MNQSGIASLSRDIDTFLGGVANSLTAEAKRRAPVQSGRLQRSIKATKQSDDDALSKSSYSIGSELEYADDVEKRVHFLEDSLQLLPRAINRSRVRA